MMIMTIRGITILLHFPVKLTHFVVKNVKAKLLIEIQIKSLNEHQGIYLFILFNVILYNIIYNIISYYNIYIYIYIYIFYNSYFIFSTQKRKTTTKAKCTTTNLNKGPGLVSLNSKK